MRFRLVLVGILVTLDLLALPAVARLPPYLIRGGLRALPAWQTEWLARPLHSAWSLVAARTPADRETRRAWLLLQLLVAGPVLALLWPSSYGLRGGTQEGVPRPDPSGAHGTARWRTRKGLTETLLAVPFRKRAPPLGLLAGVDSEVNPKTAYLVPGPGAKAATNPLVLVIGASGSGKTRRLVLPTLYLLGQANAAGARNSLILSDPKGELYSQTAAYFRDLGYNVVTLNLIDPRRSNRYNPIHDIQSALAAGDISRASEAAWDAAHAFATVETGAHSREDPFWQNAGESIIAATSLYVASRAPEGQQTMETVYRMITEYGHDGGEQLDTVFAQITDLVDPARLAYGVTSLSVDKTRSGILTTAAVNLRLFADQSVAAMTAASDYELASLGTTPTVVYLLLPDDKSSRNAIAAMYLSQTYTALSRLAAASKGGRLEVPVFWLLDEFANIGKFRDFDKQLSVMRGRGMGAMIILQALQQLEARYGKETAGIIASNCDTWLFLRTNDRATATEISEKLGKYTIRTRTGSATSRRYDLSTGSSEHLAGRPLLTPDEVLRWQMGQALVMQAGAQPARLPLADISAWPARFVEGGAPPLRDDPPPSPPWLPGRSSSPRTPTDPPGPRLSALVSRTREPGASASASATTLNDLCVDSPVPKPTSTPDS